MLCLTGRPLRLCKNRIQECHQFGRSQDSPHADAARSPRLDHCSPGQVPAAMPGGRLPHRRPARQAGSLSPRSCALGQPDGIRAQDTPKLAGAGQVGAIARPEGEVLGVAGEAAAGPRGARGSAWGAGEAIVWIRPRVRLLGISPRLRYAPRQLREVVTAALTDGSKWHGIPGEAQSDLVGLADPIPAADRVHGQH
jgi:hypothetical protein